MAPAAPRPPAGRSSLLRKRRVELRIWKVELRISMVELRIWKVELRISMVELRIWKVELRISRVELQIWKVEMWVWNVEKRTSVSNRAARLPVQRCSPRRPRC